MGSRCCHDAPEDPGQNGRYRRVLWIALAVNAAMFFLEIVAGLVSFSASLQADALDFLADAANYGISLFVAGRVLRDRASAALIKGMMMGFFGVWVLVTSLRHTFDQTLPRAMTMGMIGSVALIANAACLGLLWTYRGGDSNRRSAWLCSRNDAIGNLAVLLAALGVFGTGSFWPDVIVALIMSSLALQGASQVIRHSVKELKVA